MLSRKKSLNSSQSVEPESKSCSLLLKIIAKNTPPRHDITGYRVIAMILLSENAIIKKLGNTIWIRARDYYRHRHILETWMDGVWLTAMVKGSGGERYKSTIQH